MEQPKEGKHSIVVTASLSVDDKTRPWLYLGAKRTAAIHKSDFGGSSVEQHVEVHNGHNREDLTLDDASFELVDDCYTSLSTEDFYAIQAGDLDLTKKYYDEITRYLKEKLKCDEVVCMHSQVRNGDREGKDGVAGYATGYPHTDSSPISADEAALGFIGPHEKYERYMYVNLWRNISDNPIENDHLALLDERTTVKPDDYIARDFFGAGGINVVQYCLNARHAATHKWYYFPNMHKDEGILFKQSDSDWTKPGRTCFHMSVNDPETKDHRPRESIEVRILCFWKKADSGVDSMPTYKNTNAHMIKDPLQVADEASSSMGFSLNPFTYIKKWVFRSKPYTGNPEDYLKTFVSAITYLNFWPAGTVDQVKSSIRTSRSIEHGIKLFTAAMVMDNEGYNGTRAFTITQKNEIVDFLVKNEEYMSLARKQFVD
mmetsp:Transcript_8516/g.12781  ORF Transcript_8516/g.12781 Transcript_8516/m.12781 type:complete len:430 (-) Transcript_8516:167-1456(-)